MMFNELDEFLSHPSKYTYDDMRKSCEAVGAWRRVHDFILRHYESGAKVADEERWPLAKIRMIAPEISLGIWQQEISENRERPRWMMNGRRGE